MEQIYSAAIWYKDLPSVKYMPTNIDKGVVVEGHRHADIIRTVLNLLGKRTIQFGENSDLTNKNYVKFQINLPEGGRLEELENYQVAHFRMLSDSNFIPYGKSIIEGGRIFK